MNEIRRFLLGSADDAVRRDLETHMREEEFDRDIAIAENDLIEEYLEGTLPDDEKLLFEKHYLSSGDHRDLMKEIALLKRYSSGPAEAYLTGELRVQPEGPGPYKQLAIAAVIVMVGLLAVLSWRMFQGETRPQTGQEYAELNAGDLSDLSQYPSMLLAPDSEVRQARQPRFPTQGPGTSFLFRMPVNRDGRFNAVLLVNGREAFRAESLKTHRQGDLAEVRLLVPRDAIATGQAEVVLTGEGAAVSYPFTAE